MFLIPWLSYVSVPDKVEVIQPTIQSTPSVRLPFFRKRQKPTNNRLDSSTKDVTSACATTTTTTTTHSSATPFSSAASTQDAIDGCKSICPSADAVMDDEAAAAAAEKAKIDERIKELGLDFFTEDFEGVTVSSTKCLSCETVTEQKETMIDLSVPITGYENVDAIDNPHQFIQVNAMNLLSLKYYLYLRMHCRTSVLPASNLTPRTNTGARFALASRKPFGPSPIPCFPDSSSSSWSDSLVAWKRSTASFRHPLLCSVSAANAVPSQMAKSCMSTGCTVWSHTLAPLCRWATTLRIRAPSRDSVTTVTVRRLSEKRPKRSRQHHPRKMEEWPGFHQFRVVRRTLESSRRWYSDATKPQAVETWRSTWKALSTVVAH